MKTILKTVCIFGLAHSLIACASSSDGYYSSSKNKDDKTTEQVLTDAKGMSLYTFDKDTAEVSNCNGGCAALWPPLLVQDGEQRANYTPIKRNDGSLQWALNGQPLYTWVRDTKPGDTTGDGVKGVWHLAKKN